jgi:DNA-binding protein H-NS
MADYDLEALSLPELKKMQKDIAKAISTFEDRQELEARTKVEAVAREMGYSLAELIGTDSKPKRTPPVSGKLSAALLFLYFSGGRDRKMIWDIHRNENLRC